MDMPSLCQHLILGIGNPLRTDDGVGAQLVENAADVVRAEIVRTVSMRTVHQLTPELAPELVPLQRVLFIDAWLAPEQPSRSHPPRLDLLHAEFQFSSSSTSHRLEPAELLAITAALYGRAPRGSWLRVPAYDFRHGTELSAPLRASLPAARELLRQWLQEGGAHA